MIIYSSITMRDLIRNYRNIIARKCESDTESEPLMASTSSSSRSFGTLQNSYVFNQDLELDSDVDVANQKMPSTTPLQLGGPKKNYNTRSVTYPARTSKSFQNSSDEFTSSIGIFTTHDQSSGQKSVSVKDPYASYKEPPIEEKGNTQSSIVTIFSIWNTTMGSSLLAMSWGFEKTGLFPGLALNILVAALCLYTCYVILKINEKHGIMGQKYEVCDLCKELLGPWAEILAKIFSVVVLLGADIVYWVLMSNFLYNSVTFFYDLIYAPSSVSATNVPVMCPGDVMLEIANVSVPEILRETSTFDKYWDLYSTVPIYLAVIMFPLLNFKSPTFFTKFNSLGTISVAFIIIFVMIKSYSFGINVPNWRTELYLKPTFAALSGMLSLSYFIHNIIISIMRSNRRQENNTRDLSVAFGLVTITYIFLGVAFYVAFPLAKSCIEDNILNNFPKNDVLTIIARILLLFQLFTVFPLLSFMLRNDIFTNISSIFKGKSYGDFSYKKVAVVNVVLLIICICFACFMPKIGTLIRYTGAASGLVYIFMLPSLLKIASLKKEGSLTTPKLAIYIFIIIIGALNLISQFLITV